MRKFFRWMLVAGCCCGVSVLRAHSGKARFHLVIDTDAAADDLRAICMLLGNREAEVLAVTTSEGALQPLPAARRVASLLAGLHHEGIPVGAGRETGMAVPAWRAHAERVDWGTPLPDTVRFVPAQELIGRALAEEEERVVFVALGPLTNLNDVLRSDPSLGARIERVIWYDEFSGTGGGANFRADSISAREVLASGIPVEIVSGPDCGTLPVTGRWLDSVAVVPTPHARKIAESHRTEPLAGLVAEGHPGLWDDLAVAYLFAPEAFRCRIWRGNVTCCQSAERERIEEVLLSVLKGKPDAESRVFWGFPTEHGAYAADVVPWIDRAIACHGPSEWRACVLTNELHGHLGIYATIGVKMGIRAREYFNIGVDDIEVVTYAGRRPPVSCMNDGLQVGTGASLGHGLIEVAECAQPRPEASFTFKGKTIRLKLKPEYADRIRCDVARGVALHGDLTEPYWQYVRELALRYWCEFDRHELFELQAER